MRACKAREATTAPSLWAITWRSTTSPAGAIAAALSIIRASRGTSFAASPAVVLLDAQTNGMTKS